jgi:CheY-like chemotaxis protein
VAVHTLAGLGYQADVANDGREALELLAAKPYQVVLMDCHMPNLDGYETTRELRRRETSGWHTPVVAMTAGALSEDRQRCLDSGMDDHLTKPIDPDELKAIMEKWTGTGSEIPGSLHQHPSASVKANPSRGIRGRR